VNVTWKKQGRTKKIKVKKRVQSVEERAQMKKQSDREDAINNANKPPPEVVNTLDTRTPQEKLLAAKKKLAKIQGVGKFMQAATLKKVREVEQERSGVGVERM
jgi:hypothetical protein